MSLFGVIGKIAGAGLNTVSGGLSNQVFDLIKGGPKPKAVPPALVLPPAGSGGIDSVVTRGGGLTLGTPFGPATIGGSKTVTYMSGAKKKKKVRRMNPLNPKALSRSIRRVGKFADFAKSVGFTKAPAKLKGVHAPHRKRSKCR